MEQGCKRWPRLLVVVGSFFFFIPNVGSHSINIVTHATFLLTFRLSVIVYGRKGVLETNKTIFDWNRKKPKQDLFRLCFFLFCETKNKKFGLCRFISVFQTYIETNRTVSIQIETTLNFQKNTEICSLSNCFGWSSVCFDSIETSKLSVSV
jgi:hypothetical protein